MAYDALQGSSGTGGGTPAASGYGGNPDELASLAQAFDQAVSAAGDGTPSPGDDAAPAMNLSPSLPVLPMPYSPTAAAWQALLTSPASRGGAPVGIAMPGAMLEFG